jgi:hypothetical protein
VTEPLVRKVDHVFVPVRDPEPLFSLFTETLALPVAWPVTDRGLYGSAAACAGNANIEFIAGDPTVSPFFEPTEPLTVRGIAFEPEDGEAMLATLDERAIPHAGAGTFVDDTGEPMFTNVFLDGMAANAALIFLCEYKGETAGARRSVRDEFAAGDGGPIKVRGVAEITLGVSDVARSMDLWRRFLAPAEPDAHGAFHFGDGPVVRLKPSPIDGVAAVWLEVASLAGAHDALRERDLLGPMRASGIGLNYAKTGGLDVWLTESR